MTMCYKHYALCHQRCNIELCLWCSCQFCAFCTQCSISLGVLICIECSGVHRSLGVAISKVCKANKLYIFLSGTYAMCVPFYTYVQCVCIVIAICTNISNALAILYVCHITFRKDPFLTYVLFLPKRYINNVYSD